jgi:hypothetical protein
MNNRRKERRYQIKLAGKVRSEGTVHRIETENLSINGVRITLDMPLLEGAEVEIVLRLPGESAEQKWRPFTTTGEVVWCNEHIVAGFQAGIRFTALQDARCRELGGILLDHAQV